MGTALWQHPSNTPMLDTNILNLLPKDQQDPTAQKAFQHVAEQMEDQVVILVGHDTEQGAIEAADSLASTLSTLPLFQHVDGKISTEDQMAWIRSFAPYKAQLLTPAQRTRLAASPQQQVKQVIQTVYNPFSGVTGSELASDPFLLFREYVQSLNAQNSRFKMLDGYLTTSHENKHYVLLRATLRGSSYSIANQQLLPSLIAAENDVAQQFNADILHTGVIFYAAFGTESARSEISTIGLGSLVGVILLVLAVYRSVLPLGLTLLSVGAGLATAFAVSLMVFGQIHLFSLVMGASLIGVSIDYAFHFLTERLAAGQKWHPRKGWLSVRVPITFGLISTLIAYLSMLVAPFPGLQQLALFSACGLIGAFLSVMCWFPVLAASPSRDIALPLSQLSHHYLTLWRQSTVRWGLPFLAIGISALGLHFADYNDNIQQLQSPPQALKMQEQRIQSITGLSSSQPMLLVRGSSEQDVLEQLYTLSPSLDKLKEEGAISNFRNLADIVPPASVQKADFDIVQALYASHSQSLATTLGLPNKPAAPDDFTALLPEPFLASAAGKAMSPLWLGDIDGQFAAIVLLQEVTDTQQVQSLVSATPSITLLNKAQEVSALFGEYRTRISVLMSLSVMAILLVLAWRFDLRQACLVVLPPVLAAGVGLAAGALSSVPMNLFNLLGLFLVLGIGIDYALFFAEQKDSQRALLANSLAALTTILSFGLLSLSKTEAIHSFGITVLVGISIAWLLSPLAIKRR
ncbi:MMPL family transporter [Enterovibrio sp. ZSDZ42]|uniref:MMPL family transporter n=1 Tax=Enterovibrio gelatinilyticus TaxID=2899819 RepID=A0ABT5QX67_9GAMM|nr:MMPL family transporter [Enterovibrio sp. ZSDZ42]MDD1791877.1 MMPL family transporter [Enterovibrio sp. ZSDZ42]